MPAEREAQRREVGRLLGQGLAVVEVGRRLGLSPRSVRRRPLADGLQGGVGSAHLVLPTAVNMMGSAEAVAVLDLSNG